MVFSQTVVFEAVFSGLPAFEGKAAFLLEAIFRPPPPLNPIARGFPQLSKLCSVQIT
jgi:hypothetical protein